jgi:hypothetical protein
MRPKGEPKIKLEAYIPETLYNRLSLLLMDVARGRPMYGLRSKLVTDILAEWLERQTAKRKE